MSEVYFALENVPYLYDLNAAKLYRLAGEKRQEVVNDRLARSIRFHSVEITRSDALQMSGQECRLPKYGNVSQ
jgi:hypothetical protein